MPSSELESIITRNANFLSVRRAGSGDGQAGLYDAVSGKYIAGIGGGWLPEYSRHMKLKYNCECTPRGECRTGAHGTNLMRGWRNILHELIAKDRVRISKEIKRVMGEHEVYNARDYGMWQAPMANPAPDWIYRSL